MSVDREIILCNLYYSHQVMRGMSPETTQQERFLLLKNNTIYVESTYNSGPKIRDVVLHIDFEIDEAYIKNLQLLLFGVLKRNEANKHVYKSWRPVPQYPIIWIGENIVDFKTSIMEYNKIYLSQKNMQKQLLSKDDEIAQLKKKLAEKDGIIQSLKNSSSIFSLDNLGPCSGDSEFIEITWPHNFIGEMSMS